MASDNGSLDFKTILMPCKKVSWERGKILRRYIVWLTR